MARCQYCGAVDGLKSHNYEIEDRYWGESRSFTTYYCSDWDGCQERCRRNEKADALLREARIKADKIRRGEVSDAE